MAKITCVCSTILVIIIILSTLCIQYDQLPVGEQKIVYLGQVHESIFSAVSWWYIYFFFLTIAAG